MERVLVVNREVVDKSRKKLIEAFRRYLVKYPSETKEVSNCMRFVEEYDDCFFRSCKLGHITTSTWIESKDGNSFLLTKHRKLKIWLQVGGHIEVGENLIEEGLREAREESGIQNFQVMSEEIFDFDRHVFPEYKGNPEHYHFDVRFYLKSLEDNDNIKISDESDDLKWFQAIPENSGSFQRMFDKWKAARQRLSA